MYQYSELPTFLNSQPSSNAADDAFQAMSPDTITPPDCPNAGPYVGEGVEVGAANLASDPETTEIDEDDMDDMDDDEDGGMNPDGVEKIRRDDSDEMPGTSSPEIDPQSPNQMRL